MQKSPFAHGSKTGDAARGAIVLISAALVVLSLLPLHDESYVVITETCPATVAADCASLWIGCLGSSASSGGQEAQRQTCEERLAAEFPGCDPPEPSGSYSERLRRLGPWWLKLPPGGRRLWYNLREGMGIG